MTGKQWLLTSRGHVIDRFTVTLVSPVPQGTFPGPQHPDSGSPKRQEMTRHARNARVLVVPGAGRAGAGAGQGAD